MKHCGTQYIKTPRLLLRPFVDEDCDDMIKIRVSDSNVHSEYGEPVYTTVSEATQLSDKWKNRYSYVDFYRPEAYHRAENVKSAMQINDTVPSYPKAKFATALPTFKQISIYQSETEKTFQGENYE